MNKYYFTEKNKQANNASNKAREDIEKIFGSERFFELDSYVNINSSSNPKFTVFKELYNLFNRLDNNDFLYIQYPYYSNSKKIIWLIKILCMLKKINLVTIIHDLDSLRYQQEIEKEISFLNYSKYIISHNSKMSSWLKNNNCISTIIDLDIFDYILESDINLNNQRTTDIVFAGNLDKNKSEFVYNLKDINFSLNLYGPNFIKNVANSQFNYCGQYSPEKLIFHIEGKYGLIWDGDSLESCNGMMGEYTKYNNPHKLSMYVVAELPVICWSKMAIADFVKKNNIGFCIEKISDIDGFLEKISQEEYDKMLKNVLKLKSELIKGNFTKKALSKIKY
ncbi:hypothetical protein [Turicibacter sanguinis]|uniref:hypothetical protein n=1 Tax=Turicibacter sanguinis TaxID=154288 RepID=UPI00189ADDE8|nr:hypothetical protein [Turicibacter sanguinis]